MPKRAIKKDNGTNMFYIRPVKKSDLDTLMQFSLKAGLGIRNLPKNKKKLEEKIDRSILSFSREIIKPLDEEYSFVLEDLYTGNIEGTCGIKASIDPNTTQNYKIEILKNKSKYAAAVKEIKFLKLVKGIKQASEICSLFLNPESRHSGLGRLLSLSRFLFIASHKERFRNQIVAELRGFINQKNISPFWQAVGQHFFDMSFEELMMYLDEKNVIISEIIPKFPLYIDLLPKEAREVIGITHETTKPAEIMLLEEGFKFTREIDVLEAGPTLMAATSRIRSIRSSKIVKIEITKEEIGEKKNYLIANLKINFRACYGKIKFVRNSKKVFISSITAEALQVKNGDLIRYILA